jgi:hypothetical protein
MKLYRCGWCGAPTDSTGLPLHDNHLNFERTLSAEEVLNTNGHCCEVEAMSKWEYEREQMYYEE